MLFLRHVRPYSAIVTNPLSSVIVYLSRSVVLGLVVALFVLILVPDLREGSGLSNGLFGEVDPRETRTSYHSALSKSAPAVVNIYSVSIDNPGRLFRNQPRQRTNLGSGIVMTENGYLLTCYHVVWQADSIYVALQDSSVFEAQIVGYDSLTDLAVLKIAADDLQVIPQLNEPDIKVGDTVMAIGNPYDLGQTITHGIVSRAGRNGLANYFDFIQTDAVLNKGNSGGALVDSNGYLVGVTNANFKVKDGPNQYRNVDGINFAVPYELAKKVMDKIISNGKVVRGALGFQGEQKAGSDGITVIDVTPNSPADIAGLRRGDVILAIDGIPLESASKTLDMIAETPPGNELTLEVSRLGDAITVTAKVERLKVVRPIG